MVGSRVRRGGLPGKNGRSGLGQAGGHATVGVGLWLVPGDAAGDEDCRDGVGAINAAAPVLAALALPDAGCPVAAIGSRPHGRGALAVRPVLASGKAGTASRVCDAAGTARFRSRAALDPRPQLCDGGEAHAPRRAGVGRRGLLEDGLTVAVDPQKLTASEILHHEVGGAGVDREVSVLHQRHVVFVGHPVAVVVESVADLDGGLSRDRVARGQAGLASNAAGAFAQTDADRAGRSYVEAIVDFTVAVVVQTIADLGSRIHAGTLDLSVLAGHGAGSAESELSGVAGRAATRVALVDLAVAVVVATVTDLGAGVAAGLVDHAVAVFIVSVATLFLHWQDLPEAVAEATVLAGLYAGAAQSNALSPDRAGVAQLGQRVAQHVLVCLTVAVVVESVTDLGGGLSWNRAAGESIARADECALTSALADAGLAGHSQVGEAFIDLAVAVVVHVVAAALGPRNSRDRVADDSAIEADSEALAHACTSAQGADTIGVHGVVVDHAVAVVVHAIAELGRGEGLSLAIAPGSVGLTGLKAGSARANLQAAAFAVFDAREAVEALVSGSVAVVVLAVGHVALELGQGLAVAVAVGAVDAGLGACVADADVDLLGPAGEARPVEVAFVRLAVAVVVHAVAHFLLRSCDRIADLAAFGADRDTIGTRAERIGDNALDVGFARGRAHHVGQLGVRTKVRAADAAARAAVAADIGVGVLNLDALLVDAGEVPAVRAVADRVALSRAAGGRPHDARREVEEKNDSDEATEVHDLSLPTGLRVVRNTSDISIPRQDNLA